MAFYFRIISPLSGAWVILVDPILACASVRGTRHTAQQTGEHNERVARSVRGAVSALNPCVGSAVLLAALRLRSKVFNMANFVTPQTADPHAPRTHGSTCSAMVSLQHNMKVAPYSISYA